MPNPSRTKSLDFSGQPNELGSMLSDLRRAKGLSLRAVEQATGKKAKLVAGAGGIFEIRKDGEVIWKKQHSGHFPKTGEAAALF